MAPSPLQHRQLIGLPFASLALGVLCSGFYWPLLGGAAVAALALVLSLALVGGGLWIAARSDFATRHGRIGAAYLLGFLVPLTGGAAVMTLHLAGTPQLAGWGAASTAAALLGGTALSAALHARRLAAEGPDGPWWRGNVDLDAARVRDGALTGAARDGRVWAPALVAGLAVNVPLLWRLIGSTDAQAMPFVFVLLLGTGLWVCAVNVGPMLARAAALAAVERRTGRPFRHEGWDALQALRRRVGYTRWLMERDEPGGVSRARR
jgi:hypothetical protein